MHAVQQCPQQARYLRRKVDPGRSRRRRRRRQGADVSPRASRQQRTGCGRVRAYLESAQKTPRYTQTLRRSYAAPTASPATRVGPQPGQGHCGIGRRRVRQHRIGAEHPRIPSTLWTRSSRSTKSCWTVSSSDWGPPASENGRGPIPWSASVGTPACRSGAPAWAMAQTLHRQQENAHRGVDGLTVGSIAGAPKRDKVRHNGRLVPAQRPARERNEGGQGCGA